MTTPIQLYQVDAFAEQIFSGNPAAVCPLQKWLSDDILQNIAAENNLSETAFFVPKENNFELRWFTPLAEVELCGHATLATSHVLFNHLNYSKDEIIFHTRYRGDLKIKKNKDYIIMDFPKENPKPIEKDTELIQAIGKEPQQILKGKTDYLFIYNSQKEIENIQPNFELIKQKKARGIIITAPGNQVDFVSRFFAPAVGINEDPVTGSAHTLLTPYWANQLHKEKDLVAHQLSKRGGKLICSLINDRVILSGKAKTYLVGKIYL